MAARSPKPTHFIAIQLKDPNIIQALQYVQQSVVGKRSVLQRVMIPPQKFHFSLMVFVINSNENMARAKEALNTIYARLIDEYTADPLEVVLEGIGNFSNKVVYVKAKDDRNLERLENLSEVVKRYYEAASPSLRSTDGRPFQAHMTLMKMAQARGQQLGFSDIDPNLYAEFVEMSFGTMTIDSLQLCSMSGIDKKTGYYNIVHEVHF